MAVLRGLRDESGGIKGTVVIPGSIEGERCEGEW